MESTATAPVVVVVAIGMLLLWILRKEAVGWVLSKLGQNNAGFNIFTGRCLHTGACDH